VENGKSFEEEERKKMEEKINYTKGRKNEEDVRGER
jgi:hypothetical protein